MEKDKVAKGVVVAVARLKRTKHGRWAKYGATDERKQERKKGTYNLRCDAVALSHVMRKNRLEGNLDL